MPDAYAVQHSRNVLSLAFKSLESERMCCPIHGRREALNRTNSDRILLISMEPGV